MDICKSSLDHTDSANLNFQPVDIPHDWLIYNTENLYENSMGWYRKQWSWNGEGAQVLLCFDGVYMDSSVYVNGHCVGEWKYGYSSFEHEITDFLAEGENDIVVKVVFQSPNSRWYSGAGIYRNVWLKIREANHIATDGIYISTTCQENGWLVEVDTEMNIADDVVINHTLLKGGQRIAEVSDHVNASKDWQYDEYTNSSC